MLKVPRPATRADCLEEARPCPWVGCPHHLLLEIAPSRGGSDRRPTTIRLNAPARNGHGRREGLRSSAALVLVRAWIDDAVEHLAGMEYSCELDVLDDYPDGIYPAHIARLLGVSEQLVDRDVRRLTPLLRGSALQRYRDHEESGV